MKKHPEIPASPTLAQLQQYQAKVCLFRGWDQTPVPETFLLLTEEIGELAKAIRNQMELYQEEVPERKKNLLDNLQEEFADVLSYLFELANRFQVDLEQAYRTKEKKNQARNWE